MTEMIAPASKRPNARIASSPDRSPPPAPRITISSSSGSGTATRSPVHSVSIRSLPRPNGTAPNWQNHRFPRVAAFVVELPAGPLPPGTAGRYLAAILAS